MKKKINILGVTSIFIGLTECFVYLFDHFFVSYYVAVGIRGWFSSLCFALLLIIAGVFLLKNKGIGLILIKGHIFGTLVDRVIIFLLFGQYVHYLTVIFPILLSIPLFIMIYFPNYSKYLNLESSKKLKLLIVIVVLLIILLPKILFA